MMHNPDGWSQIGGTMNEYVTASSTVRPALIASLTLALTQPPSAQTPDAEAQLRALMREPVVARAFRVIHELEPHTLADHIALTQIPAPPFKGSAAREGVLRLAARGRCRLGVHRCRG